MSTATKTKPRRLSAKDARLRPPDMKAFAARATARLKARYGDRIIADSSALLEDLRKDAAG